MNNSLINWTWKNLQVNERYEGATYEQEGFQTTQRTTEKQLA